MKVDGIDKATGEIMKPYETPEHQAILKEINRQVKFVRQNVYDDEKKKNMLEGQSGDNMIEIMTILISFYEMLGRWCADERLHVADMKLDFNEKFANTYINIKKESQETNETARMRAQVACAKDQKAIEEAKHALERIDRWRKAIHSYWETVRSALGHEKSLAFIHSREQNSA